VSEGAKPSREWRRRIPIEEEDHNRGRRKEEPDRESLHGGGRSYARVTHSP
jgi:hypothetical protein